MEPLATYRETRFDGVRLFSLYPDHIAIKGKQSLVSDFEASLQLETLVPTPHTLRQRHWLFRRAYITCLVGIALKFLPVSEALSTTTAISVFVVGALIALLTFRKVEYVQFVNQSGIVVLDIARAGKQKHDFDAFVGKIVEQIKIAKGNNASTQKDSTT